MLLINKLIPIQLYVQILIFLIRKKKQKQNKTLKFSSPHFFSGSCPYILIRSCSYSWVSNTYVRFSSYVFPAFTQKNCLCWIFSDFWTLIIGSSIWSAAFFIPLQQEMRDFVLCNQFTTVVWSSLLAGWSKI